MLAAVIGTGAIALGLASPAVATHLSSTPVPASHVVTANGLEWVYAAPCNSGDWLCPEGSIAIGKDGFGYATAAQWAQRPLPSAFDGKCATPYFYSGGYDMHWCDFGDAASGYFGSAPFGGLPGGSNGLQAMSDVWDLWLVRGGSKRGRCADQLDVYRAKVQARTIANSEFSAAKVIEHAARGAYYADRTQENKDVWDAAKAAREAVGVTYAAAKQAAADALAARQACLAEGTPMNARFAFDPSMTRAAN